MGLFRSKKKKKACSIRACTRVTWARNMCSRHYQADYRSRGPPCDQPGCTANRVARGMCVKHYQAEYRTTGRACSKRNCTTPAFARKLCIKHYHRWYHEQLRTKGVKGLRQTPATGAS